jgi:hypothetical protein
MEKFSHTNFVQSLAIGSQFEWLSASYDGQIKAWDWSPTR